MLDYFVAIAVALVGLLVVYFMFQSINRAEVVAVAAVPPEERKSRARKTVRTPRRNDTELDRETEDLIAREVARQTTSMRSDIRVAQPTLLENLRKEGNSGRGKTQTHVSEHAAEKQMLIDKELGFQTVTNQPKARKAPASNAAASVPFTQDEEMDRKLGLFFSNNRKDKKPLKFTLNDEQPTGNGAQVVVKKDISNARSW
ncbi:uncharacterized protein TM35_000041730 [Trypanosoma theileri]|uniref:Uncharacterized protein n=1 Tax=Trypanosoma theileri TaxID=67003 RepID=A0A1X0P5X3_9TRYP|nr:uncharacterized protein TM35_000041730 [Trypanosoma theileri]ORC91959.1 hypothetical protein TM35_000041730 [Trypanosoma theileri]